MNDPNPIAVAKLYLQYYYENYPKTKAIQKFRRWASSYGLSHDDIDHFIQYYEPKPKRIKTR
jgi:hypothetical protein